MMAPAREPLFPLIRHLSRRVTPLLVRTPLSPNAITFLSLICGLAAAWLVSSGGRVEGFVASALLVIGYVFDNCDGEVAGIKGMASRFGAHFDSAVDWIVHASFFIALGYAAQARFGDGYWDWSGWAAAAGATINYALWVADDLRGGDAEDNQATGDGGDRMRIDELKRWGDRLRFVFRELTRADFCFLVAALALLDLLWLLVPAGAVGAQVYWLMRFSRAARTWRV